MMAVRRGRAADRPRSGRRRTAALVLGVFGAATLAACGGGGGGGSAAGSSDTLTVALPGWTPESFDLPTNCSSPIYELAYEPLIRLNADGEYEPGIAESWEYSENNTVFTLEIRDGLKFADGTDVTVDSVVDTLNYYKSVPGLNDGFMKPLTIAAEGADSVRISYDQPHLGMEDLLSSDGQCNNGMIISPAGLKNPEKLKTDMFGAGPYEYVAAESEPGDHYTYTPNPNYYDKSRQHWQKIVLRVIGDPNTAFNALATGQVQVNMVGGETLLDQAKAKGFDVVAGAPWGLAMMVWDRGGAITKPLADVRVRQAMAFALDRDSLAKVTGPATKPQDQFGLPGLTGADPDLPSKYTYDVDRAKQLMAEAGYPDGFSTTLLVNSDDPDAKNAITASVEQLAQIGIQVDVKSSPETTFYSDVASAQYPLGAVSYGFIGDVPADADRLYKLPYSAVWNPFGSVDPDLDAAYAKLATSDASTVEANAVEFNDVMTSKAWYIPISYSQRYTFSKGIDVGVAGSFGEFDLSSWTSKG
jgi:peptide/nickel transport system substrate-binding protein